MTVCSIRMLANVMDDTKGTSTISLTASARDSSMAAAKAMETISSTRTSARADVKELIKVNTHLSL